MATTPKLNTSSQRGAALIVSLIVLLVLTLIALSGMNSALLQERMSANAQNTNKTFQAAESAVGGLTAIVLGGDQSLLDEAADATDGYSSETNFNMNDAQVGASHQVRYLGATAFSDGVSMSPGGGGEDSTGLQVFRYELIGIGRVDSASAQTRVFQGIEYR